MDDASPIADPALDFDPDALRDKYRQERDKRLRRDGEAQYIEVAGAFARFAEDDPYADPAFTREPLTDEIEIAVIGGGFSGLLAAARLREAGLDDFRIIEAGGDFGGTWYWNRYPGAQCDIESYCYLPLLEELGYMPKEKYSYVNEIFEHSQRIGHAYGLYERACFQTRVTGLRWDEALKRWRISTNRNDDIRARFVVMALGPASRPKLPGIPGIETFEGHSFHTSRWDYDYTGGDTTGESLEARRQARCRHRHRGDGDPVRPPCRQARQAALRVPAHALERGLSRQQADRRGVGPDAAARMATGASAQLRRHRRRASIRGRPRQRWLDRHLPQSGGRFRARTRAS